MARSRLTVGFIGLGAMGRPMATNLARKLDSNLRLFDVRADLNAIAAELGGHPCQSAAEVAVQSDVVITMLPDDEAVLAVLCGENGVIESARTGQTILDFSTIGPWTLNVAAEKIGAKGARVFGGAVTLGVKAATDGTLAVYLDDGAANDPDVAEIVSAFSGRITATNGLGSSKVMKLINNLMVGVNVAATAEAVALAEKAGLPSDVLVPLISKGSGSSYALVNHIAKGALANDVGPGKFGVDYILKDLNLALELARRSDHPAFFGALSMSAYRGAKALGLGANYYPVVLQWIEHAAGQESPQRGPTKKECAA